MGEAASLPVKLVAGCALAAALPCRSISGYALNVLALYLSAFATGGIALCAAFCAGVHDGLTALPVGAALVSAALACFMPRVMRGLFCRDAYAARCSVQFSCCGQSYAYDALVDTGSALIEPVSGLPVIVVFQPELKLCARVPVPAATPCGRGMLYAFVPDGLTIDGASVNAMVAPSDTAGAGAIVPPLALPAAAEKGGGIHA